MNVADQIKDTLVIQSQFEAVTGARHWAAHHAQAAGFDSQDIFSIELALGEALTNIIRHAYNGQPGHEIHLSLTADDTQLSLTVIDFGRKFDPAEQTPPQLDKPREGGYGMYLINKSMDKVIYNTTRPQGTQLELVKYRIK